jgi:hypothetical protein
VDGDHLPVASGVLGDEAATIVPLGDPEHGREIGVACRIDDDPDGGIIERDRVLGVLCRVDGSGERELGEHHDVRSGVTRRVQRDEVRLEVAAHVALVAGDGGQQRTHRRSSHEADREPADVGRLARA